MRAPDDPYPEVIGRAIEALIATDHDAARRVLEEIPFEPQPKGVERWPPHSVIARIYARDCYQCRYCGERVILAPVMRLLARIFPAEFPYHQNWKADSTHPAFISRGATLDHVVPIAFGGDPVAEMNLVTACWGCNRRKGDFLLEEIGWELREAADSSWQGLSEYYEPLWSALDRPQLGEEEMTWMRAVSRLAKARHDGTAAPSP